jgi:hypothetical protein
MREDVMTDAALGGRRSPVVAGPPGEGFAAPVEYAVAVDRYLADASLGESSRRVYRISLAGWAWALADREQPVGQQRRGARPPVVPLAWLDSEETGRRLAAAVAARSRQADATVNRELSALRSAVGWWLEAGWISADPTAGLRVRPEPGASPLPAGPLTDEQVAAVFAAEASLREQAFWHLLHDTGAPAPAALGLDAGAIDRHGRPKLHAPTSGELAGWSDHTAELLAWLLSGRTIGPVFRTDRRAAGATPKADVCPLTRRARLSYRRAAEIFTSATGPLDPAGRGWTLHQLRRPRRP